MSIRSDVIVVIGMMACALLVGIAVLRMTVRERREARENRGTRQAAGE